MSSKIGEAFIEVGAHTGPLGRGLADSEGRLRQFAGSAQSILAGATAGVTAMVTQAGLNMVRGLAGGLKEAIFAAGDLSETISKTEVVFGSATATVVGFGDRMREQFGSATGEILNAASSFGLIFKGAGMAEDASARLSVRLAEAADDAASLFNSELPEALEKIRAGLVGESEPLRAYGVMLSETAVQQEAIRLGLAKSTKELSEQAKIMARASLIEKGLAVAKGDHARTQSGFNNQMKEFGDRLKNLGTSIGSLFIGPLGLGLKAVNALMQGVTWLSDKVGWLAWAFSGFNREAEATVKVAGKVKGVAGPGGPAAGAGGGPAGAGGGVSKADSKAFDARKEILEEEKKATEDRALAAEREKRAAEVSAKRDAEINYRTLVANGTSPYGGSHSIADTESWRRDAAKSMPPPRELEAVESKVKAMLAAGLGMAAQLKNDALGVVAKSATILDKSPTKLRGGVTDSESYARELQEGALNGADIQRDILGEAKAQTTKLGEILKAVGGGARDMIARFN